MDWLTEWFSNFQHAIERAEVGVRLTTAAHPERLVPLLEQLPDNDRLDWLLVDIRTPMMTDHEVLAAIRANEHLKELPMIVFTTSSEESDILRARHLAPMRTLSNLSA